MSHVLYVLTVESVVRNETARLFYGILPLFLKCSVAAVIPVILVSLILMYKWFKCTHKGNSFITAVTTNTRPIALKRVGQSCVLVDVNQRKAVGIIFKSLQHSKATWQEIENLTSLREGKSCLN